MKTSTAVVKRPHDCKPPKINLVGRVFDRLTVLEFAGRDKHNHAHWRCRCSCTGAEVIVYAGSLQSGNTTSCGCTHRERVTTHGLQKHPLYSIRQDMIDRCTNSNYRNFHLYGGRGIAVCKRWLDSLPAFIGDVGPRPSPRHSLDRLDPNGGYHPGNVRWATPQEQARNRRDIWTQMIDRGFIYDSSEAFQAGYDAGFYSIPPIWFTPTTIAERLAYARGENAGAHDRVIGAPHLRTHLVNVLLPAAWEQRPAAQTTPKPAMARAAA